MAPRSNATSGAPHPLAPLGFLLQSGLCQGLALGVGVGLRHLFGPLSILQGVSGAFVFIALQALVAAGVARWIHLPPVWQIFNLALVPAVASLASFEVPVIPLTIIFGIVALLYLPTFWTRVPYYPTSLETYSEVAKLLPANRAFKAVDLGCGFGPLLRFLARRFPHGEFRGIEISPLAFLGATIGCLNTPNVTIRFQSIWQVDLGGYDVVYAFLAPGPMPELWAKVVREMRPGSVFISNTFEAPAKADEVIAIPDKRGAQLYVYRR